MNEAVRSQYDAYPYPPRRPADEARRLIEGSPSHLGELNHYVFSGRMLAERIDTHRPFRALVAGGGTGDGLIMLAQHCADAGLDADIVYLDMSTAARRIAEARAERRGLSDITFLTGSLLDVAALAPGPFDYIDCCGVLHHLDDPLAGLQALAAQLSPDGGMGLMVYAPYGRTGVYPMQSALRRLTSGLPDGERVALAKRTVAELPQTNWLKRNPLVADHRTSDAGVYDLLLHSRDCAMTVDEVGALVDAAGLAITSFIEPVRYLPETYLQGAQLRNRAAGLAPIARAALAEELAGNLKTHVFYAVPAGRLDTAVARPDDPAACPVLRDIDGLSLSKTLRPGQALTVEFDGFTARLTLPPLAGAMLARIGGRTDLTALHTALAGADPSLSWGAFSRQFTQLFTALNGANKMYLRF